MRAANSSSAAVSANDFRRQLREALKHVVGQPPHLDAVLFDHGPERRGVPRRELVEHVLVDGACRGLEHELQIVGQRCERLRVDDGFEGRAGFVPAGVVVVLGDVLQSETPGRCTVRPTPSRPPRRSAAP